MWRLTKIRTKWIQNINKPIKSHVRNQSIGQAVGHSWWTVHFNTISSPWGKLSLLVWEHERKRLTIRGGKKKVNCKFIVFRGKHTTCKNLIYFWFKRSIWCWFERRVYHLHQNWEGNDGNLKVDCSEVKWLRSGPLQFQWQKSKNCSQKRNGSTLSSAELLTPGIKN